MVPSPTTFGPGYEHTAPFDPPAWSLLFEFLANFTYAAFVHRLTRTPLAALLIFGAIIVLAQSYVIGGVRGGNNWDDLYLGFGRVFFPFLCGIFLFRRWSARPPIGGAKLALVVAIALLVALFLPVPRSVNWLYESLAVLVVFPLMISAGALNAPGPRATSFLLFLGQLSYPLYILHWPLLRIFVRLARSQTFHGLQLWLLIAVAIFCTIGFSIVILKILDEPVREWLSSKWRSWRQVSRTLSPLPR